MPGSCKTYKTLKLPVDFQVYTGCHELEMSRLAIHSLLNIYLHDYELKDI